MKTTTLLLRRALLFCVFLFGIFGVSWGQVSAGFNTSFVVLSLNSGANTYYDLQASTSNTDFNGASLGSFTAGTNNLLLKGAEHNVYKCGGADLTSTRVYYRIYLTSAGVSGSFTSTDIGYSSGGNNGCGGQDQQWRNLNYSTNLLSGLAPGNYSIQVYSNATITCCGGTALADNSGNNYTATFTVTGNYYSKSTGNLELTSSWGTNTDGTGNVPVNFTTAGNTFNIRNNSTPTIGASWTVSGTGSKIVVGDGTNACNFTVPSTFTVTSPTTEVVNNGMITRTTLGANSWGTLSFASGATYVHNVNGGSIPTATWNTGSTFEVTGITSAINFSSGSVQNFYHIVWNCASQTSIFSFGALTTINGNLTILSTGATPSASSGLFLTNSTAITATIGGNLTVSGGFFAPFGVNTASSSTLNISGNLSISGGTFDIYRPSSNTGTINLSGDFSMTGGTLTKGGAGTGNFNFSKNGTQTYSKSSGTISNAINFTVNSGSTLSMGTNILDGSTGTFTLSPGGGIEIGHTAGITLTGATGSIQVTGRTYNTGANYTFNGSSAQVTGDGFTGANNLTINNSAGVTLSGNASLAGTLTLTSGTFTVGSGYTITVSNGGAISRTSGALAAGTGAGTFTFLGTGTVTGTVGFNNVNIAGGVNFGSSGASTINGTLTINAGGFVSTNAPIYASGSTLKYNSGGTYGRGTEWSATSGAGYPHHVQISNGTTLDLGANNGAATARQIAGNLTVDASSIFSMSVTPMTAALTVKGNYLNSGTTVLSSSSGGDLILEGNLNDNATFTANSRAIFFQGANNQYINSTDNPLDIDVVRINKSGGEVILNQNLLVDETADPIQFAGTLSILNLNGKTATFGKASTASQISMNSTSAIKGSATSGLTILGTGSFGTLRFDQTTPGTTNVLGTLNVNRTGTNAGATLGDNLTATTLNITSGTLTLAASKQLTVSGTLTNNGTFTLENGATFKQGSSVTGGGTYNVKQTLSDGAGSGSTLTGRYWYMGTPVSCARSVGFESAGNLNKVWSFTNGAYAAVADATLLSPTTGYVHRRSDNPTLTFSGQNLYATDETLSLSNNAGTYGGWHLIANPYTAYLDWSQVYTASHALSTAISPSYYIRSFNSTGNDVNALITYNSSTGLESNTSSYSLGSTGSTIAQHIAPMQAIWVKVNPTTPLSATAGQLRLERAFTSHQTGNVGLKNTSVFPTLARVNLVDDARFDQMLVFMNQDMSNAVDQYDSEKMFVSGATQIYTMAAGKKLVMNGLKNNKKKISVPLYLELPTSKVYQLQLSEYIMEDGLIILEDKQEGTMQDFTIHDTYAFYASSGVLSNRFVLHFFMPDATITAQGPSNSWVEDETSYTEGGQIVISADGKGKVQITLDQPDAENNQATVQAVDANGRVVYSGLLEGITTEIQLDVPSGVYYLTVQSGNLIEKKKMFIQE